MRFRRTRNGTMPLVVGFRRRAVTIALALCWAWLIAAGLVALQEPDGIEEIATTLAGGGAILLVLTLTPWRKFLASAMGGALIFLWSLGGVAAVTFSAELGVGRPSLAGYLAVVVFAGLLLPSAAAILVTAAAAVGHAYNLLQIGGETHSEAMLGLVGLVAVAMITSFTAEELQNRVRSESLKLNELRRKEGSLVEREAELEHLYAVARTIGAGNSLSEVVPELIHRVVDALNAETGFILIYRAETQALVPLDPIWQRGAPVAVDDEFTLLLTEEGIPQEAYVQDEPRVQTGRLEGQGEWDTLRAALDLQSVVAAPLQVEGRRIGVLVVANKIAGGFEERDQTAVASLAAPAALVLDHIIQFEEAQETSVKMAELAQLKSDFVSVISHELRTPLTSIIGNLKTLARPELAPQRPESKKLLDSASAQADRLRGLIEDLLVMSRVDRRALPVRPVPTDIESLLAEVIADVPEAEQRVQISVAPSMPRVVLDPGHVRRILMNLINNSMKYGDGSPIEMGAVAREGNLVLTVADHGPGLPFEMSDAVFDRFTQLDRTEVAGRGGMGLGLSICRGLAEAMGGRIRYEPTIGGGATFKLTLPLRPRTVDAEAVTAAV